MAPYTRNESLLLAVITFVGGMFLGSVVRSKRKRNTDRTAPRRFGGAIRLRPEEYRTYRELHDNVWPGVLRRMYLSNIRNFTIYYHEETHTMFSHFEWIGHWQTSCKSKAEEEEQFRRDMESIATDPVTLKWWAVCEPCQRPFSQWDPRGKVPSQGGTGDWWAPLECVNQCGYWATSYGDQERDPDFITLGKKEGTT